MKSPEKRFTGDWSVALEHGRTTPVNFEVVASTRKAAKHQVKATARRNHGHLAPGQIHISFDEEGDDR